MKKILYTIFGTFLLTSCLYDAMYFLTDKDLEWMAPYKQGDTVLFQSSGGIDTMTIDKFMLYNDDNPWRENEGTSIFMGNPYRLQFLQLKTPNICWNENKMLYLCKNL